MHMDNEAFQLTDLPAIVRDSNPKQAALHDERNAKLQRVDLQAREMLDTYGVWVAARLVRRWAEQNVGVGLVVNAGWMVDGMAGVTDALNGRAYAEATRIGGGSISLAAMWRLAALVNQHVGVATPASRAWDMVHEMIVITRPMDLSDTAVAIAQAEAVCDEAGLEEPLP